MKRPLRGTAILGVRQTGDLEGRDAKKVLEIYRSLAEGASLLPPAIAFILDQECRSEDAKRELNKLSGGRLHFLRRRMYENYLLNSEAIAAVMNGIENISPAPITPAAVQGAIDARVADRAFHCPNCESEGLETVDGARVLEGVFNEFSETRESYKKVVHGIALTEWLIENHSEELAEVSELLGEALERRPTSERAIAARARSSPA